jgi:hypothetical protein
MKRVILLLASSLCVVQALATTYVRVEKDGSKTYSDRPLPGGQEVDLQPAQTYSAPSASTPDASLPREQQLLKGITDFRYSDCSLSPRNDETFTNPSSVSVSVSLLPALRPGDQVDLRVDGARVGGPTTLSFGVAQPFRGAHSVSLTIKDGYGKTLCTANTTFHVFRPSLNAPARRKIG